MKCIHFFIEYYGVAPLEVMLKMYRQKIKISMDEMVDMLMGMPVDWMDSVIYPAEYLEDILCSKECSKENPLYTEVGYLVYLPYLMEQEYQYLRGEQVHKEFYIPSVKQIEEISKNGYEINTKEYKKLKRFFIDQMNLTQLEAEDWCIQIWESSYEGESPLDTLKELTEDYVFDSEQAFRECVQLLMDAHNHTRMKTNRGHTPIEVARQSMAKGAMDRFPTIVPGSSHAASMLKDAAPELQAMGFSFDIDGDSDVVSTTIFPQGLSGQAVSAEKKVYPNDSCPCGSGKKYKKCCGKRR